MTDQDQPDDEREFDDPSYDAVRALLASARVTEPVPDDVAARLDTTLAELTADRRGTEAADAPDEATSVVVPLRRRSRLAPRLLAAAAAVVVVGAGGIGISQVLSTQGDDLATADSAQPEAAAGGDDFGAVPTAPAAEAPHDQKSLDSLSALTKRLSNSKAVPRFTTTGFTREVAVFSTRDLRLPWAETGDSIGSLDGSESSATKSPEPTATVTPQMTSEGVALGSKAARADQYFYSTAKAACPGPIGTAATLVPILYDGQPASLAVHPEMDDTQLYEAWSCDGRTLLASAIVPR